ncbi:hypothetical protein BdWA1_002101 [Babesia duncani]|uniref:Uncharacterized protein n=1 Tax=Babesia duncani TaxID=323732 RepID=A0AAD9PL45_9APIC|nr:hypothetical protein BdWA1_002101 [Babesia duncani]
MDSYKNCENVLLRRYEAQCDANYRRLKLQFGKIETKKPKQSLLAKILKKCHDMEPQQLQSLAEFVQQLVEMENVSNIEKSQNDTFNFQNSVNSTVYELHRKFNVNRSGAEDNLLARPLDIVHADPISQEQCLEASQVTMEDGNELVDSYCRNHRNITKASGPVSILSTSKPIGIIQPTVFTCPKNALLSQLQGYKSMQLPNDCNSLDDYLDKDQYMRPQVEDHDYVGAMYPPLHTFYTKHKQPVDIITSTHLQYKHKRCEDLEMDQIVDNHDDDGTRVNQELVARRIFRDEIQTGRLQHNLLLKILTLKLAAENFKAHLKDPVAINKSLGQISWGGLWGHWHFFKNPLVPETEFQEWASIAIANVTDSNDEEERACLGFISRLNQANAANIRELLDEYASTVLPIIQKWRLAIYSTLAAMHQDAQVPQIDADFEKVAAPTSATLLNVQTDQELEQRRLQLLPRHDPDAVTIESLSSLEMILGDLVHVIKSTKVKHLLGSNAALNLYSKITRRELDSSIVALDAMISLLLQRNRQVDSMQAFQKTLRTGCPPNLASWLFCAFFTRNATGAYSVGAQELEKLMCHIQWLCIYLIGPPYNYDFGIMHQIDFKGKSELVILFERCTTTSGLVRTTKSPFVYTIAVPLPCNTMQTDTSALLKKRVKRN